MKLLIFTMPALLFVVMCSSHIQRSMGRLSTRDTGLAASPEATRLIKQQVNICNAQLRRQGKPPIILLPASIWNEDMDTPSF